MAVGRRRQPEGRDPTSMTTGARRLYTEFWTISTGERNRGAQAKGSSTEIRAISSRYVESCHAATSVCRLKGFMRLLISSHENHAVFGDGVHKGASVKLSRR